MISLDYKNLIKKYNEILTSTSRGFDTEHEFLEPWVPNLDINQSVSDLINSAIDYKTEEFELILTKEELEKLQFENLKKKFLNICSLSLSTKGITFFLKNK